MFYIISQRGQRIIDIADTNEEEIRILQGGPDEEKSELVLEKVCVLSVFG